MEGRRNLPLLIGALWIAEVTGSFETAMILAALKRLIQDFGNPAMVGSNQGVHIVNMFHQDRFQHALHGCTGYHIRFHLG